MPEDSFLLNKAETIKAVATGSVVGTFTVSIILSLVMGSSLKLIWPMISSLQLIVNLPLFKINIPSNVKFFCGMIIKLFKFDFIDTSIITEKVLGISSKKTKESNL